MTRTITLLLVLALAGCQALSPRLHGEGGQAAVTALMLASSEAAAKQLAQEGAYSSSETLRLTLPARMEPIAEELEHHGFGPRITELELLMNIAAERAAADAAEVFAAVIADTPISSPRRILRGDDDAATRYLWEHARDDLAYRYRGLIQEHLNRLGFYESHRLVLDLHQSLPVDQDRGVNLEDQVVRQALVGLMRTMAEEERRLREEGI